MNANLYALFRSRFPDDLDTCWLETADGQYYSWRDLERGSAKIANLLASLKLPEGSRIAAQVEKSAEALMLYLATVRAGWPAYLTIGNKAEGCAPLSVVGLAEAIAAAAAA